MPGGGHAIQIRKCPTNVYIKQFLIEYRYLLLISWYPLSHYTWAGLGMSQDSQTVFDHAMIMFPLPHKAVRMAKAGACKPLCCTACQNHFAAEISVCARPSDPRKQSRRAPPRAWPLILPSKPSITFWNSLRRDMIARWPAGAQTWTQT